MYVMHVFCLCVEGNYTSFPTLEGKFPLWTHQTTAASAATLASSSVGRICVKAATT